MFVIESCQKIEYDALFMMIFIPVSNFGDQPLSKTNNTVCAVESAESDYLTFLDNSFCPENTDCLPNGQCLTPCQKTSDCEYGEYCER